MFAVLVGTADKVGQMGGAVVGNDLDRHVDRADGAGLAAERLLNLRFAGKGQRGVDGRMVLRLDLVQLVIATQDKRDQGLGLVLFGTAEHDQRFHCLGGRQVEELAYRLYGGLVGGVYQSHLLAGDRAFTLGQHGGGLFHVRGVAAGVGKHDGVLTGLGQHVKLVGAFTANGTVIRHYWAKLQTQPGEDIAVGLVHAVVGLLQGFLVQVEGVGVLHDELTGAHQAEARTDLIAELGLHLVHVDRQLFVTGDLVAGQLGDDFLVGRADAELAIMTILEAQQLRSVLFPAAGFLPQFGGLDGGHQHFQRTGAVHFLAHNLLRLAQYPQPHGQPGIQAGGDAPDQAGAQHQLVADDGGIAGGFLEGGDQILTGTHGMEISCKDDSENAAYCTFAPMRRIARQCVLRCGRQGGGVKRQNPAGAGFCWVQPGVLRAGSRCRRRSDGFRRYCRRRWLRPDGR